MKALSIRQPWAWLIVNGHKDIENRTWSTGTHGTILIHASKGMTQSEYEAACAFIESKDRLRHLNAILPVPADLERGGIVGQADIVDCVRDHHSPWFTGEFGFVIRRAKPLPFRPSRVHCSSLKCGISTTNRAMTDSPALFNTPLPFTNRNQLEITMNATAKPEILVPDTIGAPFDGGFYGGKIRIGIAIFAIVWAPKAEGETKAPWLDSYTSVPGAISSFDSMANTKAMAEAGSPLAKWALGLNIAGHTDWCVPARDVLEMGYRYLKPSDEENSCSFRDGDNPSSVPPGWMYTEDSPAQTTVEAFQQGNPEAFEEAWHWSSTQYSDDGAFSQYFSGGLQSHDYGEEFEARCRAVRLIQLST